MKLASPEGAGDTVNDPSSDEEAASTDDESDPEDPTVAWCPPIPDAAEDPSEDEMVSAADKLAILITTREALLSEAGFEKVFRTQNWVRQSKLFCR